MAWPFGSCGRVHPPRPVCSTLWTKAEPGCHLRARRYDLVVQASPTVTVVVVARDRWAQAPATLDLLLARTDPRHEIVVVDARAPRCVAAALDRRARDGRVRVVRRPRHLAGNAARNLGADGARTEWVAFVENDAVLPDGWLDRLLAVGELRDAASVYPAYVIPQDDGTLVHGLGAELTVGQTEGRRHVREHQHDLGRPWRELEGRVAPVARPQSEYHALVMRRELLERMGGLDEELLSWFDHTDLALHHLRLGVDAWLVPDVVCTYVAPPPVARSDVPSFLLRWGQDWYDRSLAHLCRVWDLDPHDEEWAMHADYRMSVWRRVVSRRRPVTAAVERAASPFAHVMAVRNDDGH
jgi:GT2 family glycosyltransferase